MYKIESFGLFRLRNNDHFQFMTDVDTLILKYSSGELGIGSIYSGFKSALSAEDAAMRVEMGSGKSKTIETLDARRDNTWNAINNLVKAFLLSPNDNEVQAALAIKRVLDLYGAHGRFRITKKARP